MGSSVFFPSSTPASLGTEQAASLLGIKPAQFTRIAKKLLQPERFYVNAFKQNCALYSQSQILEVMHHEKVVKARERTGGKPDFEAIEGEKIPVKQSLDNGEIKDLGEFNPIEIAMKFGITVSGGCKGLTFWKPQERGKA